MTAEPGDHPNASRADDIRSALSATLATAAFSASPQMAAFLTYVVEEQLAGRGDRLKAYSIATEALGKDADFDAQGDPFVRVLATRVRKALELVAAQRSTGAVILLPAGGYRPVFRHKGVAETISPSVAAGEASSQTGKGILILVLATLVVSVLVAGYWLLWRSPAGTDAPAETVTSEGGAPESFVLGLGRPLLVVQPEGTESAAFAIRLRSMLARFDDLLTVSREDRPPFADRNQTYELAVTRDQQRLRLTLVRSTDAIIIWSRDLEPGAPDEQLTAQIATELAQPYGILFADVRRKQVAAAPGEFSCIVNAMDYWLTYRRDRHAEALQCVRLLVRQDPMHSAAHANLAMLLVEGYRRRWLADDQATLEEALRQATRAVELAPASARARQALVSAHFVRGDRTTGLAEARAAVALNPFDMDVLADLGARLIQKGQFGEGRDMLSAASRHAAVVPPWRLFYMAVAEAATNHPAEAMTVARQIVTEDFPLGLLARLVAADRDGNAAERSRIDQRLRAIAPTLIESPEDGLIRRGFAPDVASTFGARVRAARVAKPQG